GEGVAAGAGHDTPTSSATHATHWSALTPTNRRNVSRLTGPSATSGTPPTHRATSISATLSAGPGILGRLTLTIKSCPGFAACTSPSPPLLLAARDTR